MDPRPLPPGFISQYDPNTQRYFYVDTNTGASQWNHPLDMKPPFPPSVEQTSSQYPTQFPNPNPQEHYPLGFTDPSSLPSSGYSDQRPPSSALPEPSNYPPTTYGRGDQMPESATNPYAMMQQQSSSSYPQLPGPPQQQSYPQPPQFPGLSQPTMQQQFSSSYPQPPQLSGPPQQQSYPPPLQPSGPPQPTPFNYPPSYPQSGQSGPGQSQSYLNQRDHRTGHGEATSYEKGMNIGKVGKVMTGAVGGAAGGLLVGKLVKKKHKKHKGWKGKGWKGKGWKGWKGKGWKGKGWKGWK